MKVLFYETESGKCPMVDFLDGLSMKMRAKVLGRIELLEQYGSLLGMPYARHLDGGIFELRSVQGSDITRVLYLFLEDDAAIVTHGFVKKTQKTPKRELERAKAIRSEWRSRNG